jgi:hypothetical protein
MEYMMDDAMTGDPAKATTWGTFALATIGPESSLWTVHDRARLRRIEETVPIAIQGMTAGRLWAEHAGRILAQAGFTAVMDIAAGVPERGYLHHQVSSSTRVFYNDIDPDVVRISRDMLTEYPNVRYANYDIRNVEAVLEEAAHHFGNVRRVGILGTGLFYFLSDDDVKHILEKIYEWCAPGSYLGITGWEPLSDNQSMAIMRRMYSTLEPRYISHMQSLMGDWQPIGKGLQPIEDLLDDINLDAIEPASRGNIGYAGMFEKPA